MTAGEQLSGESSLTVLFDGTRQWRNSDGQLHRIGGPAIEGLDGSCEHWRDGVRIDPVTGKVAGRRDLSTSLPVPGPDWSAPVAVDIGGVFNILLIELRRRLRR